MHSPYGYGKSPVMISTGPIPPGRHDHGYHGEHTFREPRGLFHPSFMLNLSNSGWHSPRFHEESSASYLLSHDGLSPLLVPTPDILSAEGKAEISWPSNPRFQPHPISSPRQRPGFARGLSTDAIPSSPFASEEFPSPALPVLSPQATKRLKRAHKLNRTGIAKAKATVSESQFSWLALYFVFNLGLTLYNKLVLVRFPFPYTLTGLHTFAGSVGGWVLMRRGAYVPSRLSLSDYLALAAFSVLFAVNIAVSNISLELVTVPFHQVVRAATPIFTTALSILLFGTRYSHTKIISLIPVMAGVTLATYGDYYFTLWGFLLTLLGTFLAALKTIYTNVLQTSATKPAPPSQPVPILHLLLPSRLRLHPLDLLTRMAPLATVQCVVAAYLAGELTGAQSYVAAQGTRGVAILLGNAFIAFGLNVVSLSANKRVGALNMTVAANVKQVLTILCAVMMFNLTITGLNAAGIAVALAGGAWYAWVEYAEKQQKARRALTQGTS